VHAQTYTNCTRLHTSCADIRERNHKSAALKYNEPWAGNVGECTWCTISTCFRRWCSPSASLYSYFPIIDPSRLDWRMRSASLHASVKVIHPMNWPWAQAGTDRESHVSLGLKQRHPGARLSPLKFPKPHASPPLQIFHFFYTTVTEDVRSISSQKQTFLVSLHFI
jgi:hypothetical protein